MEKVEKKEKKARKGGKGLEIIIAILLAVTALLTAWSSWVSGLHGSNQASNYAASNNLQTEGNSLWNEATQSLIQDMLLWNDISSYQLEYLYYTEDYAEKGLAAYQLYYRCVENLSDSMAAQIGFDFDAAAAAEDPADYIQEWLQNDKATVTPFSDENYIASYYTEAQTVLDEAEDLLTKGNEDNANSDKYGLATVFFSLVLFMLGIVGTFKHLPNRVLITIAACVILVFAIVYMLWVPLPRGFSFLSYFVK